MMDKALMGILASALMVASSGCASPPRESGHSEIMGWKIGQFANLVGEEEPPVLERTWSGGLVWVYVDADSRVVLVRWSGNSSSCPKLQAAVEPFPRATVALCDELGVYSTGDVGLVFTSWTAAGDCSLTMGYHALRGFVNPIIHHVRTEGILRGALSPGCFEDGPCEVRGETAEMTREGTTRRLDIADPHCSEMRTMLNPPNASVDAAGSTTTYSGCGRRVVLHPNGEYCTLTLEGRKGFQLPGEVDPEI